MKGSDWLNHLLRATQSLKWSMVLILTSYPWQMMPPSSDFPSPTSSSAGLLLCSLAILSLWFLTSPFLTTLPGFVDHTETNSTWLNFLSRGRARGPKIKRLLLSRVWSQSCISSHLRAASLPTALCWRLWESKWNLRDTLWVCRQIGMLHSLQLRPI